MVNVYMSKLSIKFKLVNPERTVYEGVIIQATLPTNSGEITVLPQHCSYIASLKAGEIIIKEKNNREVLLVISGGFIEFHGNELVVLADTAERAEEIDLKRAQEARKEAQKLKSKIIATDEAEYARVLIALEKQSARIRVAKKYHTKRGIKL